MSSENTCLVWFMVNSSEVGNVPSQPVATHSHYALLLVERIPIEPELAVLLDEDGSSSMKMLSVSDSDMLYNFIEASVFGVVHIVKVQVWSPEVILKVPLFDRSRAISICKKNLTPF